MTGAPEVTDDFAARLFDLTGRTAVITGGASGLGRAIAQGYASAGAQVVIVDLDLDNANAAAALCPGGKAVALQANVTDKETLDDIAEAITAQFGKIDILVNSAGVSARHAAEDFPEDDWQRIMDVNLKGVFLCCQAFGRQMLAQKSGAIVNLASIVGISGYPGSTAYSQSKGAVVMMTRNLAAEWIDRGVRVNALAPSLFATPMAQKANAGSGAATKNWLIERTPMQRFGEPHEIIGPAIFLASDAASMVTGHILAVDGGFLAV